MKMDFSKDELSMVYQYAAGTKEETLAGLKEIVPVIRDRQTREIVESTIRKLDRRLAEAKTQARTEKPHPKRKEPDRERS